MHIKQ